MRRPWNCFQGRYYDGHCHTSAAPVQECFPTAVRFLHYSLQKKSLTAYKKFLGLLGIMLLQLMHSIVANDFLTHLVMPAQIYAHIFNNREHQATPAIE